MEMQQRKTTSGIVMKMVEVLLRIMQKQPNGIARQPSKVTPKRKITLLFSIKMAKAWRKTSWKP